MSENDNRGELAELSRHYDSMLWTVTSLWAAAVGSLLVYLAEHFDPWLAVFGLSLTVCAMYFAFSFRRRRRKVHAAMPSDLRRLLVKGRGLRQWDIFLLLFLGLTFLWGKLLIQNSRNSWPLWLAVSIVAGGLVAAMWACERWRGKPDA